MGFLASSSMRRVVSWRLSVPVHGEAPAMSRVPLPALDCRKVSPHSLDFFLFQSVCLTGIFTAEKAAAFSLLKALAFTLSSNCCFSSSENPAS